MDIIDQAQEREQIARDEALAAMQLHPASTPSLSDCEICGKHIPVKRQRYVQGVTTCVKCQEALERGAR